MNRYLRLAYLLLLIRTVASKSESEHHASIGIQEQEQVSYYRYVIVTFTAAVFLVNSLLIHCNRL